MTLGTVELEEREFAVRVMESNAVPSERERSKFFDIAKRAEPMHWAVRHFERWLLNLERGERFDPVGRMHLCYCFRHTRQLEKAVKGFVLPRFLTSFLSRYRSTWPPLWWTATSFR